ncbi:MAG: preprotein translocase subunit SecE [Candidatus Jidaibacter sp.]|nr:preprotein translocase subunit SecE [Candidatus Jidaibacter sp.]
MVNIVNFYKEVKSEVLRVVWPTRKETMLALALVLGMVVIAGLFFLLVDSLLFKFIKLILG